MVKTECLHATRPWTSLYFKLLNVCHVPFFDVFLWTTRWSSNFSCIILRLCINHPLLQSTGWQQDCRALFQRQEEEETHMHDMIAQPVWPVSKESVERHKEGKWHHHSGCHDVTTSVKEMLLQVQELEHQLYWRLVSLLLLLMLLLIIIKYKKALIFCTLLLNMIQYPCFNAFLTWWLSWNLFLWKPDT